MEQSGEQFMGARVKTRCKMSAVKIHRENSKLAPPGTLEPIEFPDGDREEIVIFTLDELAAQIGRDEALKVFNMHKEQGRLLKEGDE
jgi:hypothetical protein